MAEPTTPSKNTLPSTVAITSSTPKNTPSYYNNAAAGPPSDGDDDNSISYASSTSLSERPGDDWPMTPKHVKETRRVGAKWKTEERRAESTRLKRLGPDSVVGVVAAQDDHGDDSGLVVDENEIGVGYGENCPPASSPLSTLPPSRSIPLQPQQLYFPPPPGQLIKFALLNATALEPGIAIRHYALYTLFIFSHNLADGHGDIQGDQGLKHHATKSEGIKTITVTYATTSDPDALIDLDAYLPVSASEICKGVTRGVYRDFVAYEFNPVEMGSGLVNAEEVKKHTDTGTVRVHVGLDFTTPAARLRSAIAPPGGFLPDMQSKLRGSKLDRLHNTIKLERDGVVQMDRCTECAKGDKAGKEVVCKKMVGITRCKTCTWSGKTCRVAGKGDTPGRGGSGGGGGGGDRPGGEDDNDHENGGGVPGTAFKEKGQSASKSNGKTNKHAGQPQTPTPAAQGTTASPIPVEAERNFTAVNASPSTTTPKKRGRSTSTSDEASSPTSSKHTTPKRVETSRLGRGINLTLTSSAKVVLELEDDDSSVGEASNDGFDVEVLKIMGWASTTTSPNAVTSSAVTAIAVIGKKDRKVSVAESLKERMNDLGVGWL